MEPERREPINSASYQPEKCAAKPAKGVGISAENYMEQGEMWQHVLQSCKLVWNSTWTKAKCEGTTDRGESLSSFHVDMVLLHAAR